MSGSGNVFFGPLLYTSVLVVALSDRPEPVISRILILMVIFSIAAVLTLPITDRRSFRGALRSLPGCLNAGCSGSTVMILLSVKSDNDREQKGLDERDVKW